MCQALYMVLRIEYRGEGDADSSLGSLPSSKDAIENTNPIPERIHHKQDTGCNERLEERGCLQPKAE